MSGNSLNLIELVQGYLGGDFTSRISSLLGESTDQTKLGINAAIPGLLSAFDNSASTPEGARRLSSAVDDADDNVLDNVGRLFGAGTTSWIDRGSAVLGSLLVGNALSGLSGNIGRSAGLSGKAVNMLLGFLVPLILGVLKREKQTRGLDSTGLSNLLASQRGNISAALPQGMFKGAGERVETAYGREPLREVRDETYRTRTRTEPTSRNRLAWILPLALLLFGLGLLWNYASRRTSTPGTVQAGREELRVADQQAKRLNDGIDSVQRSATEILRSITDPTSADAAVPRLRQLNSRLDQMHSTFQSLPYESKTAVSSRIPDVLDQLKPQIGRVMNIPGISSQTGSLLSKMLHKISEFLVI